MIFASIFSTSKLYIMKNLKNKPPIFVIVLFVVIVLMIIVYFAIAALFPDIFNNLNETNQINK